MEKLTIVDGEIHVIKNDSCLTNFMFDIVCAVGGSGISGHIYRITTSFGDIG